MKGKEKNFCDFLIHSFSQQIFQSTHIADFIYQL